MCHMQAWPLCPSTPQVQIAWKGVGEYVHALTRALPWAGVLTPRAFLHVCGIHLEAAMQAEQLASRCGSMVGVMAVSSHPATTTAGVVGGSCDVASGERDRERLTASGGQSRASIVRGPVRRAEWHCRRATPSASETEKSKRKHQIRAKKGL
jgi:hypothetical protein